MTNILLSYNNEIYRKLIHIGSLIFPICYYLISSTYHIHFILTITLLMLFINLSYQSLLSKNKYINLLFSSILRNYENNNYWGATYMIIGYLLITLLFETHIVVISMVITSLSDSLAAIIGIKYGKMKIYNNKSIEGFYIFLITTFIILFSSIGLSIPIIIIICALISTVELFTPTKYDNITIPIAASVILFLFKA